MIDSINFKIKSLKKLDFYHIKKLGITIKDFQLKDNKNSKGYSFKYKTVKFEYYPLYESLTIKTNTHKLLNKQDIHEDDLIIYKEKLEIILKEILNISTLNNIQIKLSRIDYCADLNLNKDDFMLVYIYLLQNHKNNYKYMKGTLYNTSIHKKTKRGKTNMNIYDRFACTNNIQDKGILRIEIQNKEAKLEKEYKSYGIPKSIDEYWNKDCFNEYLIDFLNNWLYTGKYYKREIAKSIIKESNYSDQYKKKLYKFLLMVERYSLDEIVKKKKYSQPTVDTYIQKLSALNINPILVPKGAMYDSYENLLVLANKVANEKYFN